MRPVKPLLAGGLALAVVALLVREGGRLRRELTDVPASSASVPVVAPPDLETTALRPETYSNIYRYDYVGPETCGKCHTKNYESWRSHPHSKMNANATATTVRGDFSGAKLTYGAVNVVFSRADGEYRMTLYRQPPGAEQQFVRQFKVLRTVGSRFTQMYIGTQTLGPEPMNDAVYKTEVKLPFSFALVSGEWFPDTYDETHGRELDASGALTAEYDVLGKPGGSWKQVCIKCHNTYPYASRFAAAANGALLGFPSKDLTLKSQALDAGRMLPELEPHELVTLGISCESCHFGGREHALDGAAISFLPRSQDLDFSKATPELAKGARQSAYVVNSICNQCHSAASNGPRYANGSATWNSREASDLMTGACASQLTCVTCHNPHEAGPQTGATAPDQPKHLAACAGCHERYRDSAFVTKHARHDSKVTCLDCHMPRVVQGLGGMVRTHHIASPTDPRMIASDHPNACNVCHLDKSVAWTVAQLATGWGKHVDVANVSTDPAITRWLKSGEPTVRKLAVDAYSRSGVGRSGLSVVLPALEDESPPNRMFAALAVARLLGRSVPAAEYTPWGTPALRHQQVTSLAERSK